MATISKTRAISGINELKQRSVAAVTLSHTDFNSTDTLELFKLPKNSLIIAARAVVLTAANTSSTLDIGTTATGNELQGNLALTSAAAVGGNLSTAVNTTTGASIYVTPNQALTAGQFVVIVEYIEYTVRTGMLLNY